MKKNVLVFVGIIRVLVDTCISILVYRCQKIYSKLKQNTKDSTESVGCTSHILHNSTQTVPDILSIDIEITVIKFFSYFSIYTI